MTKSRLLVLYFSVGCLSLVLSSMKLDRRLVNDHVDMSIYQQRGSWILTGQQPYRDVFSEYPQLATYMFALPYLISNFSENSQVYRYFFALLMALSLATVVVLLYKLRPDKKSFAFFMFLPACLYFTQNRYDIVPSLLLLLSVLFLFKHRFYLASFLLATATMFKWYPIIILPIYISFYYSKHKRFNWQMAAIFASTIVLIILPTILMIGWDGFLIPYRFHLDRGTNHESLLYIFEYFGTLIGLYTPERIAFFFKPFLILQFATAAIALFCKIDTREKVVIWCAGAILGFLIFAKFYSPQWILWLSPFLILLAKCRRDIISIIMFDILTYFYFPLAYDTIQYANFGLFMLLMAVKTGFLLYFFSDCFLKLRRSPKMTHRHLPEMSR